MSRLFDAVTTTACLKTLLLVFNLSMLSSGILMLFVSIMVRIQLHDYVDLSVDGSGAALLAFASLGAILTVASTLACCCTARGHPALLYLYGAFLAVVALLELGAGASIYAYRIALKEGFDQGLNESMAVYGMDQSMSSHIDTMQSTLHCCGNRRYTDWFSIVPQKNIPTSCCKAEIPVDDCDVDQTSNIYTQGCYKRVLEMINNNVGMVTGTAIGVAFFPLVGVFLACCLASNMKAKYEQVA